MFELQLTPGALTLAELRRVARQPVRLTVDRAGLAGLAAAEAAVARVIAEGRTVYGINTGFGLLANTRIGTEDLERLQRSIVLSHAAGAGAHMSDATVRLMIVLKVNALARGYSGVRPVIIDTLCALLEHQVYPRVPSKGSVGASGDLAPLAHLVCPLLGEGDVRHDWRVIPAVEGLAIAGLEPLTLAPKEGLALLNGTQASTAYALEGLFAAENLMAAGLCAGALSVEAALGSRTPFDARIHELRGHRGQIDAADAYRHLLGESSAVGASHIDCDRVQDPYSLRCQPQVMGACLTQLRAAADVIAVEANGVTDNPLVFADQGDILSGGNFHAEPVAMAADNLALVLAEIGALSERRTAMLIDKNLSNLPPFLVEDGGVNSGFMIAQVTAAALASENKTLAHPASVDSLPTSANQEDHVSMATFAARRLADMAENSRGILAVELLAACQGLDFRAPLTSTAVLEQAKQQVRNAVPFYDQDRYFAPDIDAVAHLITAPGFAQFLPDGLLPSVG